MVSGRSQALKHVCCVSAFYILQVIWKDYFREGLELHFKGPKMFSSAKELQHCYISEELSSAEAPRKFFPINDGKNEKNSGVDLPPPPPGLRCGDRSGPARSDSLPSGQSLSGGPSSS